MEDRRLAAIMFTDIVGYTTLMGSDEKKAFEILRKNRSVQKPLIAKYLYHKSISISFNRCLGKTHEIPEKSKRIRSVNS
jgi:hypothetical protein